MELVDIFNEFNPRVTGSQIRMQCPFREKHTDGSGQVSMFISPEINAYHCFSCKSKGRLTQLLTTRFEVSLTEAYDFVNIDSYLAGAKVKLKKVIREDPYFKLETPELYKRRSYPEKILRKFKLGHNDKEAIIPFIENKVIIGYVKRDLKNTTKYSLDFKRGSHLYNFIEGKKSAIVVEGQADVWRLESWLLYSVGLGGTEFSERILDLLKEFDELYFALDNDLAGIKAANKLYKQLYRYVDIYFIEYEGEDPDKSTKESFFSGYKNPRDYYEFKTTFMDILETE